MNSELLTPNHQISTAQIECVLKYVDLNTDILTKAISKMCNKKVDASDIHEVAQLFFNKLGYTLSDGSVPTTKTLNNQSSMNLAKQTTATKHENVRDIMGYSISGVSEALITAEALETAKYPVAVIYYHYRRWDKLAKVLRIFLDENEV